MKCAVYILIISIKLVFSVPEQKWRESDDGSKFYVETSKNYNWFEAWSECARKNMSLIAIDTSDKHQQIDNLLRRFYTSAPPVWISGHDNAVNSRYEWATTGKRFSFTNWGPGQPADKNNTEHCILIWVDFQWHDDFCSTKLGYICEENQLVKNECHHHNRMFKSAKDISEFKNVLFYFLNGSK